jgi:hypothetical protein
LAASQASPRFEHEGEFRSWLVRVLIDQALAIRHYNDTFHETGTCFNKQPTSEAANETARPRRTSGIPIRFAFDPQASS